MSSASFPVEEVNELAVAEKTRLSSVYASTVNSTTWMMLVDLSDTANWPHRETGRIDISTLSIIIDRGSNTEGSVNVGVVTRINETNADVTFFSPLVFSKASETHIRLIESFGVGQLKLGVENGVTMQMRSMSKATNVSALNTVTTITSPVGSATPAVGDVVVQFEYITGTEYNANVRVLYHSEKYAGGF